MAKKKGGNLFKSVGEWGSHESGTFTTAMDKSMSGGKRKPVLRRVKAGTNRKKKKLAMF